MRVLWDVDIEIDCAVPTAPLVDGDHVVVAGGEHALVARVHRETGTVENALFTEDTDVDVSAPVRAPTNDAEARAQYAFASIDRPRLHLNITVVDAHLRVIASRDIAADDPETPELLVEGRISHFSAHHEVNRGPYFVVAVREPNLPDLRRPLRVVRCVWDDLAPRWSSRVDDVRGAFGDALITDSREAWRHQAAEFTRCIGASDGAQRWVVAYDGYRRPRCVGVAAGFVAVARDEEVEVYETLPARVQVLDIANGNEVREIDMPVGVEVRDVVPFGSHLTSVWRRGRNTYALLHAVEEAEPRRIVDVQHAPLLINDSHALVGPELVRWPVANDMTRLALALTAKARASIVDDVAYIRDGKRLVAIDARE